MVALFRLVELSSGRIEIDGVDISQLGLSRLRSSLSIIPQDAVLFSGSVRYNVDPFREHSDDRIWQALERVGLATAVRAMAGGIDAVVAEGGDNFSHGQKQLICIARAFLRDTRILVLDESTASLDPESDRALQDTLATTFSQCTVLTIAHRSVPTPLTAFILYTNATPSPLSRPPSFHARPSPLLFSL
jgi:ABC-type multidrug transport system fused ATPase/permease subunit